MIKFLLGLVVGVFIGVLLVAPNPELGDRVRNAWDDGRQWLAGFVSEAEDAAGEAVDRARDTAGDALRGDGDATQDEAVPVEEPAR
jgi:hypothetical protein